MPTKGITIDASPPATLGKLRNDSISIAWLAGQDFAIQWDDDDWHHPQRIEQQVAAYQSTGLPVCLQRQLCYSFTTDTAYVREFPHTCIQGTILFPLKDCPLYPETAKREDTAFFDAWMKRGGVTVLDNDPRLYVRFEHGGNTWDHAHIMREMDGRRGQWNLDRDLREFLGEVLELYAEPIRRTSHLFP